MSCPIKPPGLSQCIDTEEASTTDNFIDDDCSDDEKSAISSGAEEVAEEQVIRQKPLYLHQIATMGSKDIDGIRQCVPGRKPRRIILGCCLFLMLLLAVIIPIRQSKNKATSRSFNTVSGISDEWDDLDFTISFSEDEGELFLGNNFQELKGLSFVPFSTLDPVSQVNLPTVTRPMDSSPPLRLEKLRQASSNKSLPTNAWYQNLLLLRENESPAIFHRAYTLPYIVDVTGPIPGLRVHKTRVETTSNQVIVGFEEPLALTLGAVQDLKAISQVNPSLDKGYSVLAASDLGITLQWAYMDMKSSLVRGMPYATMTYPTFSDQSTIFPTIYAQRRTISSLIIDDSISVDCADQSSIQVNRNIEFKFIGDSTWLAFFSEPVEVQCLEVGQGDFALQVLRTIGESNRPLVVRLALVVPPKTGSSPVGYDEEYKAMLKSHANIYPGENARIVNAADDNQGFLSFNWDVQQMDWNDDDTTELIMFGMPHHTDKLGFLADFCTDILVGSACIIKGSTWSITEDLPPISFNAQRSPSPELLQDLAEAVVSDLNFRVPDNFFRGAGDTYFSGKALGKLSRIILIAQEILQLCAVSEDRRSLRSLIDNKYTAACRSASLPTEEAINAATEHLREAVEVWINGNAQAPFLYDPAWGGVVNCGCDYVNGNCRNKFPNCPGLTDQGLNFGVGFYNDHHFHYGYHIYAASVLASIDANWGVTNFEKVLLFIRDIANPSEEDSFFPVARHKDWYHGSSWASGITQPPSLTGMNQESSSEAIAGYEAVALFGKTMSKVFEEKGDMTRSDISDHIYKMGRVLTATELRSTKRYWHVTQSKESLKTFDAIYEPKVVGILWSSKAFFGTYFGTDPYLMYGIQLLPLTPISEERDDVTWLREMFDPYARTCNRKCVDEGWSVQVLSSLATLGQKNKAATYAKLLARSSFQSAGGNGHSLSNTLWYISTRPNVDEPYSLPRSYEWETESLGLNCQQPATCSDAALDVMAGQYSCRSRIMYLINTQMKTEYAACFQVAVEEFPDFCGPCSPLGQFDPPLALPDKPVMGAGLPINDIPALDQIPAVPRPNRITCNQPSTCTSAVLRSIAGTFPCEDRISWLMNVKGLPEIEACEIVAAKEFPDVCGGCNPVGI